MNNGVVILSWQSLLAKAPKGEALSRTFGKRSGERKCRETIVLSKLEMRKEFIPPGFSIK